jgi:hypothetical protein
MLEIALPCVAISEQTVLPSPATMAFSHDVMASSGVLWSTGTVVVLVPAPDVPDVPDDVSVGVVALDPEPTEEVCVGPWSTALEQAARETTRASAVAPVTSLFMEVLPDMSGGESGRSSHGEGEPTRRPSIHPKAPVGLRHWG